MPDIDVVLDGVGGVQDDALAALETGHHLGGDSVAPADLDRRQPRAIAVGGEHRPAGIVTEETTGGDLEHVATFPDDDLWTK